MCRSTHTHAIIAVPSSVRGLTQRELFVASFSLLLAACLFLPTFVKAEINDKAGLFSQEAIVSARRMIEEIQRTTSPAKDIVVETLPSLPSSNGNAQAAAEAFFRERRLNGILLFIVKEPHRLVVTVGKGTQARFRGADELRNVILSEFRKGRYDSGLTSGISYLKSQLPAIFPIAGAALNTRTQGSLGDPFRSTRSGNPSSGGGFGIGGLLFFGLILFFFMRLFGGLGRGLGGLAGGRRGGSFLTGLFGALAGNWMYNRFFGHGGGSAWGGGFDDTFSGSNQSSGGGFFSDDGDVGSSSSGSWSDGGDSGGGDSGDW